jgi:NitT/TauT family transport system substrate-binding protein
MRGSSSRREFLRGSMLLGWAALAAACTPAATPTSAPAPTAQPAAPTAAPAPRAPTAALGPTGAPTSAAAPATPAATVAPTVVSRATASPVAIRAAWVAKTANQMVWPLAKDAGYFDKYGVSFDLNYLNGSTTAIAALVARDLEVASVAGSAIVGAQAAGQDLIMVAGFLNQAVFRILASSDLESIDDVKGKTVAVTRVGQADYFAWQIVIEHQKWGADDVKFVNANDVAGQVGLLQQGQVQAIAVSPPNDVLARQAGAHLLLDTATLNVPEQNVGFGLPRAYLQGNRAAVTSVVKASIEAMARWKKDAAFTKGVIRRYLQTDDPQFTDEGYDAYGPLWPQVPYPSRDGMRKVIDEVSVQNPNARELNVDQLIDTSVVKELEDSGFIKQVYA